MTGMLERATFVTTTGTGPTGAAPLPPPPKPPPPPPWPLCRTVLGWPARQTAYPATPATINRKTAQSSPRFFGFPGPGGVGSCWPGSCTSGSDSSDSVVLAFLVITNALWKNGGTSHYDRSAHPGKALRSAEPAPGKPVSGGRSPVGRPPRLTR